MRCTFALVAAAAWLPLAAAFSSLSRPSPSPPSVATAPLDLVLLHVNDHHSHLEEDSFDYEVDGLNGTSEVEVPYGGFPRLVTAFESTAEKYDNVIKVHAGDAITGTSYYTLYKGEADAALMQHICFDAFEVGNHEFDDGDAGLAEFIKMLKTDECETTVLGANVHPGPDSPLNEAGIEPYKLFEFEGQTVGVIGINIKQKTEVSSQPDEGTTLSDELTTAQQYADELVGMGVSKIILLSHIGYTRDQELAAGLTGVDVIVGGDSHSLLWTEETAPIGSVAGPYPTTTVTNKDGEPVCIVQAWEYALIMGMLEVSFDASGVVSKCGGSPIVPIADSMDWRGEDGAPLSEEDQAIAAAYFEETYPSFVVSAPDTAAAETLQTYSDRVDELKKQIIGFFEEEHCFDRFPGQGRSAICHINATYEQGGSACNFVAKAFMMEIPTADLAIQNGGGCRADIAAGNYSMENAYTLLPFSNTLVVMEMKGSEIVALLNDALTNTLDNDGSSGSYPYAAGLRYAVDASKPSGDRISDVEVNRRLMESWTPIDLTATYHVVTNDYIASGRDGYEAFRPIWEAGKYENTYVEYAEGLINYVTTTGTVPPFPAQEFSTTDYTNPEGCFHDLEAARC